ncbi:hypothetical protein PF004_g14538 [Phytophthora fragariae]|uniref:Uncharacterized protein n=1 Tax=Phytophthora fragariae TaxID=53985 RepID=A0A6A3KB93_9STRA|nr:hypothetical protein PF011_g13135 [Phytophthora fragariae]KAE9216120.1 hypothetical protein PF004_g14538 [Phytophthora fragariae]
MLKHFGGNVYRADDDGAKFGNYPSTSITRAWTSRARSKDVRFRDDKPTSVGVTRPSSWTPSAT